MEVLLQETTPYNEIAVFETRQLFGTTGRFRCLRFADEAVQGAIDLRDPERVVLEYPRALMHLLERNVPFFDRVFMIGHGIGTIPSRYPRGRFTIAELDERVAAISRRFFHYDQNNIMIGDGRTCLERQETGGFDAVIVDAFTKDGTPPHLTTIEFFQLAKSRLHPHGILLMNLAGKATYDVASSSILTTLREPFEQTAAYFLPERPGAESGNLLVAGSDGPISADMRHMAGFRECSLEQGYLRVDKPDKPMGSLNVRFPDL